MIAKIRSYFDILTNRYLWNNDFSIQIMKYVISGIKKKCCGDPWIFLYHSV